MIIRRHTAGGEKIKPRKIGDAPAIGNVPRASNDNSQTPLRKRRSSRPTVKRKYPKNFFAWSLLLSFVAVSVLVVSIVRNVRSKVLTAGSATQPEKVIDLDKAFDEEETPELPELRPDEATRIVTQALANRDPGLLRDHFILGKDGNPVDAMEELIRIREAEGEISDMEWLGLKFPTERTSRQVIVRTVSGETERTRRAQFARGSDGKWRIDLDAFLRKCEPPLADVVSAESGTFMVRVFVSEETAYRGIYSDKTVWRAYSLTSPDITDSLYAYAKRGSSQDKALRRIVITDENLHHATLGIIKNPESGPRQFEVSRVIAANWIIGDEYYDESF